MKARLSRSLKGIAGRKLEKLVAVVKTLKQKEPVFKDCTQPKERKTFTTLKDPIERVDFADGVVIKFQDYVLSQQEELDKYFCAANVAVCQSRAVF